MEGDYVAGDLISANQDIPDWPVKTVLLGNVVTVIKLGVKCWFGDVGLA